MSRGVDRRPIFFTDDDRLDFGDLLREIHRRFEVEIHAYCLMTNHFHLLVRCPTSGLSDAMHHLLSVFARRVNDRTGRVGHLFGDRFTSRLLTTHRYIANVVRYIHRNPLDIAGVDTPTAHRWSSHRTYLGLRPRPPWLNTEFILQWFDGHNSFDRFVQGSSEHCMLPVPPVAPSALLAAIDLLLAERSDATPRHTPAQRRAAALVVAEQLDPHDQAQLFESLGITPGTGAFRVAMYRSRRLACDEAVVSDVSLHARDLFDLSGEDDVAA